MPCLVLALTGCPGNGTDDDDDTSIQDDDTAAPSCEEAMEAMLQEVAASPEVTVDWSGFTEDTDGNPIDPADLTNLSVTGFELLPDAGIEGICNGTLDQSDITLAFFDDSISGSTTTEIDTTGMLGATLMVSAGQGQGIYSTALVTVLDGSPTTVIYIENGGDVPPAE